MLVRSDAHEMFGGGKSDGWRGRFMPSFVSDRSIAPILLRRKGRKAHTLRCHAMNL